MGTTLNRAYRYPDGLVAPNNVPLDLQKLAEDIDADVTGALMTSSSHLLFTPVGNLDTPTSGSATWMTLGNVTVPAWATRADVSYAINGVFDTGTSSNTLAVMKIDGVWGTVNKRLIMPGVTGQRANISIVDTFAVLPGVGVRSVTLGATWSAGSAVRADATSYVTALFTWRP